MGWIGMHAHHYRADHTVDRKKECDSLFAEGCEIVKSQMVGSIYYAAVKVPQSQAHQVGIGNPYGVVVLTGTENGDGINFYYKAVPENHGPNEARCPISILRLLGPTEDEWALKWRKRCEDFHDREQSLKEIPEGGCIKVDGRVFKKMKIGHMRYPVWVDINTNTYLPTVSIAEHGFTFI